MQTDQTNQPNHCTPPALNADSWISIEERIPPAGEWAYIWANNQCHIGYVDPIYNHRLRWIPVTDCSLPAPTHWQPLPAPPAQAETPNVWMSAGDRNPSEDTWYAGWSLVWTGSNYTIGRVVPALGGWIGLYENENWGAPTHWTALPTPPAHLQRPLSYQAYCSF